MISVDGPITQRGVDAVGDVGVAGLAERDDPAVADADVALDDAPVVEHDDVGDHEVGRALGARSSCPGASTRGSSCRRRRPPRRRRRSRSSLDLDPEVGVGEADLVADRRAVERARSARATILISARRAGARHAARARERHERRRRARRPARSAPTSRRGCRAGTRARRRGRTRSAGVGLREVEVRADLDRPVAGVHHRAASRRSRPALSSSSPAAGRPSSPGDHWDRLVQRHELAAVRERRLDLHLVDELRHALHHLVAREHRRGPACISSATERPVAGAPRSPSTRAAPPPRGG